MNRWDHKISVVTGASAGIGLAIVKALLQEGLIVVGLARRKQKMEEEIGGLSGIKGKFYAVQCDVSKEDDVKKAFQWIRNNVGIVQLLINNAGLGIIGSIADAKPDALRHVVNVNFLGTVWCSKEALKMMQESKYDSHIININSIEGHRVYQFIGAPSNIYPSTKHAVSGFTETLRQELLGQNIRVTSLSPGLVKTEIADANGIPSVLWSEPHIQAKDIADAVLYIVGTPQSVQITELIIRPLGERAIAN